MTILAVLTIAIAVLVSGYFLFKDTMNRIQYIETLRIYWITRDVASKTSGWRFRKAFMRQTAHPYWRGSGVELRVGKYTFQVGRLTSQAKTLLDQLDGRELEETPKELRKWQ